MNKIKIFLAEKFQTLYYFYQYLGNKVFLLLFFNFLSVLMDGLGLTMFVPLLQIADSKVNTDANNGKLVSYVQIFFSYLNIPLNIGTMLLLIGSIFIFKALFNYFTMSFQEMTLSVFSQKLRTKNSLGLSKLNYKEFISTDIGRLQSTLTGDTYAVASACSQYIETIKNGMIVMVYMGFAFFMDWQFSFFVMIGGLLTNFIYKYFYKLTKKLSKKNIDYEHQYSGLVIQGINHFKYLKATSRNGLFDKRMLGLLSLSVKNKIESGKLNAFITALREPIMVIVVCVVIAVQLLFFKSSLSAIMIILVLFYRAMAYIMSVQVCWNNYLTNIGVMDNMRDFEKYLSRNEEKSEGTININHIHTISLNRINLSFEDFKVIDELDLEIKNRESVAFVGESGSGKTTLVNIICGLLHIDNGSFEINGKSIDEIDLNSYRSKIGYISQEPTIFNGDIFDNVTFWAERTQENIDKFNNVMKKCSMAKFLDKLPRGYNELLGYNGLSLSGGQKQRISIARELYRDIDVLIMDEATSALDSETEKEIKDSIDMLKGTVTIISIAHRLSTVQNADIIHLMSNGKIVASGNFMELKNKSIYFNKLAELQGM